MSYTIDKIRLYFSIYWCIHLNPLQVFVYVSVQAAFLHGLTAPLRRRGPPPPGLQQPHQQPQAQIQGVADLDLLAVRDTQQREARQQADDGRAHRNQVHHPNRPREKKARVVVQTLQSAARSEDETDTEQPEERPEAEQNLTEESDAENQVENKEEPEEAGANIVAAHTAQAKTKTRPKAKPLRVSENRSQDQHSGDDAAPRDQPAGSQPPHPDVRGSSGLEKSKSNLLLTWLKTFVMKHNKRSHKTWW